MIKKKIVKKKSRDKISEISSPSTGMYVSTINEINKLAEQNLKLKRNKEKLDYYKKVVADSNDAVVIQDFNGIVKSWNKGAERMYGFKAKEMIGKNITKIIDKKYQKEAEKNIMSVKKGKPILRYEQIRKSKKGEKISVWINYSPIYEDEEIIEVATTERDITSKIKSIKILAENEKKYRELFENVPALVYCIDLKGQIADCNKFACKVLGYRKKELIGKTVFKIYAPGSVAKAKSLFVKWKKNKSLINESLQIMTKKKKIIDVLLNAGLISDEKGRPLYSISVQLDISKEKKFMRELIKKQMEIEKFSQLTIGRETRIAELKKKIKELEK